MRRVRIAVLIAAGTWFSFAACRSSVAALGDSAESARRNADELFAALEYRFDNVAREPWFEAARLKMGRNALIPSRIYNDTSVWTLTSDADSSRTTYVRGARHEGRYLFAASKTATRPLSLGDESHYLGLTWLGKGDYQWFTTVDHAVGHVRPGDVGKAIVAALTAAEGRPAQSALADAAAMFPRSARHLASMFDLDSLRTTILGDGSTSVTLGLTIRADRLKTAYPAFAAYVNKYLVPSVYRLQLGDARGATYFDLVGRDGHVWVRIRSRDGGLVTLEGPPRPLPDSLVLRSDFSAKYGVFRVGYRNLVGDFTIERGAHLRAWQMRFQREPEWHFPLAFDKLIRVSLRRPFEGSGAEMRLGLLDDKAPQTISFRVVRVAVRESAIMRWLGRIGATAFGEFSGETEVQENRFLALLFVALRQDIGGM